LDVVDVGACARDVAETFGPTAEDAGLTLACSSPDAPCLVKGNAGQLERLFSNLVDNAIRHTPAGGNIAISARAEHGRRLVMVSDTGCGISPEALPHVFERFYRGDESRSRETGDFGLGLSICKQIVENYAGSISIESAVGQGTTVNIVLPAAN